MKYPSVIFLAVFCSAASSQYLYDDQPLGARIEHQSFFFIPNYINPYGIDEFSTALPGVVDHPLLHLAINPASLHSIGKDPLIFVDYRTNKEIERRYYYIMPMWYASAAYDLNSIVPPYPYYPYSPSRLSIEPSFSSALLTTPFAESVPDWTIGATYELISQSEPYYPMELYDPYYPYPYDIRTAGGSKSYFGVDFVRNKGHLAAVYTAFRFSDAMSAGVRLGGTRFIRNAERGPIISDYLASESESHSFFDDNRLLDHSLMDFTAGIQWILTDKISAGATAGYFSGTLTQFENSENSYTYGSVNGTTPLYNSQSLTQIDRKWENNGDGYTAGVQTTVSLSSSSTLIGTYAMRNHLLHLTVRAYDQSGYSHADHSSSTQYHNSNKTDLYRNGKGREYSYFHRGSLAFLLHTEKNVRLSLGVVYTAHTINRNTLEGIVGSDISWMQDSQQPFTTMRTRQSKDLGWDYDEIRTETQIPLMLTLPLGAALDMQFGINRRFIAVDRTQQTTLQYHRIETYRNDTLLTVEENKRYVNTYPSQNSVTNTLAVLFGLTFHPSDLIDINIAGVPYSVNNETHFQWMAGIFVRP